MTAVEAQVLLAGKVDDSFWTLGGALYLGSLISVIVIVLSRGAQC